LPAAVLCWRALHAPAPENFDTPGYPTHAVSLSEVNIKFDGEVRGRPEWAKPLSDVISAAIRAAGECLEGAGRSYSVSIQATCDAGGRRHSVGYRGKAEEKGLEKLFGAVDKLPPFSVSEGTVKVELWFRVGG
jgi:hypothetical protein